MRGRCSDCAQPNLLLADDRRRRVLAFLCAGRALTRRGGALLGLAAGAQTVCAQSAWPARPLRLIVAFSTGGPTDLVARVLAAQLAEQIGQAVIVDNKPGAGGNLAAELAARAAPDGYTFFYNTSAITIAPSLYNTIHYDPLRDFEPVSLTASVPMVLMVHPSLPIRSVREFVSYVKARPGELNYASSGTGTITHLACAALAVHAGLQMQHVPYKGSAPALTEFAAGTTQVMIDTINSALPFIREGRVRALAVTTSHRSTLLPELPTLAQTEMPGMQMSAWQGVVAPAGVARSVVERLNAEIQRALGSAAVRARLAAQGAEPLGSTPAQYATHLRTELARWSTIVRDTGARES